MMRTIGAFLLLSTACGPSGYDIVIVADSGVPVVDGRWWELGILADGCPAAPEEGPADAALVRVVTWAHGEPGPSLGDLPPGRYGFQARVRDAGCTVRWAGCRAESLESDGSGRIEILLSDVEGPGCEAGRACAGRQRCDPQLGCVPDDASDCSDAVDCTADRCFEPTGCQNLPDHTLCGPGELCDAVDGCGPAPPCVGDAACQDGFVCDGEETCMEDRCAPTAPLDCDDGVECTADVCVEPSGCSHWPDHAACGPGELCDPIVGCERGAACDGECEQDGLFCNGAETCRNGVCTAGTGPDCDDSVACTADACSLVTDACEHAPRDELCMVEGTCVTGICDSAEGCMTVDRVCDDGDPCTIDTCSEADGCSSEPGDVDGDGVSCPDDCDNLDPRAHPGADETCDLVDEDCDGSFDENLGCPCWPMFRGDIRYMLCWNDLSWDQAQANCVDHGGTLAVPRDVEEQAWIAEWTLWSSLRHWWIGANDRADEGVWVDPDGDPLAFQTWIAGAPRVDAGRNCAAISPDPGDDGAWEDALCDDIASSICLLP